MTEPEGLLPPEILLWFDEFFGNLLGEPEMTEPEGLLPPEVLLLFDENDTWRLTDLDAASTDGDSGITAE